MLPPDQVRDIATALRVNLEEFRKINAQAAKRGMPFAAAARALVMERIAQLEREQAFIAAHFERDKAA